MAYLVPFYLALPLDGQVNFRGFILNDEPDIPDDSYKFIEWYCPNPDCDCFQCLIKVSAVQQKSYPANVYVPLDPARAPFLNPEYPITPTALAFRELITQHLQEDPAYLQRLRDHYWLVRKVAMDRKHPRHATLTEYARKGSYHPDTKPRRKKH